MPNAVSTAKWESAYGKKKRAFTTGLALAVLSGFLAILNGCQLPETNTLEVPLLKVGKADAIVVRAEAQTMVIDTGTVLETVKPEYAVICCSAKNPADQETLELLTQYQVSVFQTRDGDITVHSDGKQLKISQTKQQE